MLGAGARTHRAVAVARFNFGYMYPVVGVVVEEPPHLFLENAMIDTSGLIEQIKKTRKTSLWDGLTVDVVEAAYKLGQDYAKANPVPNDYPNDNSEQAQSEYYGWMGPAVDAAEEIWAEFHESGAKWDVIQVYILRGARGESFLPLFESGNGAEPSTYRNGCRVCGVRVEDGTGVGWKGRLRGYQHRRWLTVHNDCLHRCPDFTWPR